ncbi:hypothetical protein [Microbulbifer spongiae]|uniref:Uncharacterized protein n=1 Tax=Microbulbifer spongiae TaxID=2944933 RepID=A0ABY9EGP2_9GAMM|nr:hypothetical protein [Microbulbifer sp. MI-G]WKD51700.1 hypothetical protein M8T91_18485 [Microbulbifer sp. MI-G]
MNKWKFPILAAIANVLVMGSSNTPPQGLIEPTAGCNYAGRANRLSQKARRKRDKWSKCA